MTRRWKWNRVDKGRVMTGWRVFLLGSAFAVGCHAPSGPARQRLAEDQVDSLTRLDDLPSKAKGSQPLSGLPRDPFRSLPRARAYDPRSATCPAPMRPAEFSEPLGSVVRRELANLRRYSEELGRAKRGHDSPTDIPAWLRSPSSHGGFGSHGVRSRPEVGEAFRRIAGNPSHPYKIRAFALMGVAGEQRWEDLRIVDRLVGIRASVGPLPQMAMIPQMARPFLREDGNEPQPVRWTEASVHTVALAAAGRITGKPGGFETPSEYRAYRRERRPYFKAERIRHRLMHMDLERGCAWFRDVFAAESELALQGLARVQGTTKRHAISKLMRGSVTGVELLRILDSPTRGAQRPPEHPDRFPHFLAAHADDMLETDEANMVLDRLWERWEDLDPEACGALAVRRIELGRGAHAAARAVLGGRCGRNSKRRPVFAALLAQDRGKHAATIRWALGTTHAYKDRDLWAVVDALTRLESPDPAVVFSLIEARRIVDPSPDTTVSLARLAHQLGGSVDPTCANPQALDPRGKLAKQGPNHKEIAQRCASEVVNLMKQIEAEAR